MKVAICPGSFDPVTKGHLDIIHRASQLFDKVIVLVVVNPDKTPSFSVEERMELILKVTAELENVVVDCYDGLLANYAKEKNACAIVKGLRAVSDFEYEFQMALTNRKLNPNMETVFLNTAAENMYLSSSMVKQIARFGGEISSFIPSEILNDVELRLCKKYPEEV